MIAKLTPQNQIELPNRLVEALGRPSHFDVAMDGNRLVLTPTCPVTSEDVFKHLENLHLTEEDIEEAVRWARRGGSRDDPPV